MQQFLPVMFRKASDVRYERRDQQNVSRQSGALLHKTSHGNKKKKSYKTLTKVRACDVLSDGRNKTVSFTKPRLRPNERFPTPVLRSAGSPVR